MEFWSDVVIDRSWNTLVKLSKEFGFIIIGGWAAYLHTKTLKSKDIDVVVDFDNLEKMGMKYRLKKNATLKKYEILIDEVSVDIYVPLFSKFVIPVQDIESYSTLVEGMKVVAAEALLILKQQAELERTNSVKGQKDRADILNLLINADVDTRRYFEITKKYGLSDFPSKLVGIIRTADKEFEYLRITNLRRIKLLKKELIGRLKFDNNV